MPAFQLAAAGNASTSATKPRLSGVVGKYPAYIGESEFGQSVGGNVLSGMTGQGSTGLRAGIVSGDAALARQAQNARAMAGAQAAASGQIGQGAGYRSSQMTEGNIMAALSAKKAQDAQQRSAEQERYTQMGADMLRIQAGLSQQDQAYLMQLAQENPVLYAKVTKQLVEKQGMGWTPQEDVENQQYLADLRSSSTQGAQDTLLQDILANLSPEGQAKYANLFASSGKKGVTNA